MPLLAVKLSPLNADEWLPLAAAAERTGLSLRTWQERAKTGKVKASLAPPPGGVGKPIYFVHVSSDPRLSPEARSIPDLSGIRLDLLKVALTRKRWLERWEELIRSNRNRTKEELARWTVAEARRAEGDGFAVSERSLGRWKSLYRKHGVRGLVPKYGSQAERVGSGDGGPTRSPEAVKRFYTLYRTEQRLPLSACHAMTRREAERRGWNWAKSEPATAQWLDKYDDRAMTLLCREGYEAWKHRFAPYIEQDYDAIAAGDQYVCDHHKLKAFVLYKGKPIRPWLTAIQDCATRVIVGWHLGPSPHTDAILMALRQAFTNWGIPKRLKIDNGKDFDSKVVTGTTKSELRAIRRELGSDWKDRWRRELAKVNMDPAGWLGVVPELGCEIVRAIPYEPQSKMVERTFRTITDGFTRGLPAFCDTSAERKPEALEAIIANPAGVPLLEDVARDFAAWLETYHRTPSDADGMAGASPLKKWSASPAKPGVAQAESLEILCSVRGLYKCGANGVRVKIGSGTLGYGQYNPKLNAWKGREVLVAVDPADVSKAMIFTPNRERRELITVAEANERVSPCASAEQLREAMAQVNRARKDAKRARASAGTRMKTASQIVREDWRHRQLRATGTYDAVAIPAETPAPTLSVIQTGFDGVSKDNPWDRLRQFNERESARADRLKAASDALGFGRGLPAEEPDPESRHDLKAVERAISGVSLADLARDARETMPDDSDEWNFDLPANLSAYMPPDEGGAEDAGNFEGLL